MEWQLQKNRGPIQGWVPIRWRRTADERAEVANWLRVGQPRGEYRIVELPNEQEQQERNKQAMTERSAQARIDGLDMGRAMVTVFVAVSPSDAGAIFALGFLLAKALGYTDADAATSFTKGFGESFSRAAPKQINGQTPTDPTE